MYLRLKDYLPVAIDGTIGKIAVAREKMIFINPHLQIGADRQPQSANGD